MHATRTSTQVQVHSHLRTERELILVQFQNLHTFPTFHHCSSPQSVACRVLHCMRVFRAGPRLDNCGNRTAHYAVCKCFVPISVNELRTVNKMHPGRKKQRRPAPDLAPSSPSYCSPHRGVGVPFPPYRGETPGEGHSSRPTLPRWGPSERKQCRARLSPVSNIVL